MKVELINETGDTFPGEMSHERFREAPFAVGAEVFVTPRESRVFVADYCIGRPAPGPARIKAPCTSSGRAVVGHGRP